MNWKKVTPWLTWKVVCHLPYKSQIQLGQIALVESTMTLNHADTHSHTLTAKRIIIYLD